MQDADLVFAVGPAYSTMPFAEVCAPYVRPGQIYVVCPSSCAGAIVFKQGLDLGLDDDSVLIAETSTLPYAVRLTGPAHITVYNRLKGGYYVAALPSRATQQVFDVVQPVHGEIEMADNVLQTTLQNGNPVIHPAVSLCNVALIERTGGDFLFYEEGVTDGVGRVIEAVDTERLAIADALGVSVLRILSWVSPRDIRRSTTTAPATPRLRGSRASRPSRNWTIGTSTRTRASAWCS